MKSKNNPYPHPLKAGHRFRLMLSGAYKPTGRIVRIDRAAGVFWFTLDEQRGRVYGPWCFSRFAGPVKKWKVVVVHSAPYGPHKVWDGKVPLPAVTEESPFSTAVLVGKDEVSTFTVK